jgi:TonB family protein
MSAAAWLSDIGSLALQLAAIVAAGAAVWQALRVHHAVLTLGYWRLLLLACLLLPIAQPRIVTPPPANAGARPIVAQSHRPEPAIGAVAVGEQQRRLRWPTGTFVLFCLGAGVAGRGLWLVLGTFSLRRLRRTARRLDPAPPSVRAAFAKVGTTADVYVSNRVSSPVTFGFRRPIVMVPPAVLALDADLQEAIACHELLHVRRRDWLHVIAEEIVRTVFWFHPAIWWLIARIQLTREHVVDEAVIRLTGSRERYVGAMLAVALSASPIVRVPAPLFLRRRLLKRRVAHILQETTMTTRRMIASVTFSAVALALATVVAVRAFPLEARQAPPHAPSGAPIEIVQGGEYLLHGSLAEYPRRAIDQRIEGDVAVELTVDDRGEVSDARVLSGPDELRRAALESVLQWHYSPDKLRSTSAQAVLRFTAPPAGEARPEREQKAEARISIMNGELYAFAYRPGAEGEAARRTERQLMELQKALQDQQLDQNQRKEYEQRYASLHQQLARIQADGAEALSERGLDSPARLIQIRTERVPESIVKAIRERAGIAVGDVVSEATMKQTRDVAAALDEHLTVRFERDSTGGLVLVILAP